MKAVVAVSVARPHACSQGAMTFYQGSELYIEWVRRSESEHDSFDARRAGRPAWLRCEPAQRHVPDGQPPHCVSHSKCCTLCVSLCVTHILFLEVGVCSPDFLFDPLILVQLPLALFFLSFFSRFSWFRRCCSTCARRTTRGCGTAPSGAMTTRPAGNRS